MMVGISSFYLNAPLKQPQCEKLNITDIQEKILSKYTLHGLVTPDEYVYFKICKCVIGLPQVGLLAQELLAD